MSATHGIVGRFVEGVIAHRRVVIGCLLLCTVIVGYGLTMTSGGFVIASFDTDAPEAEASDYVDANFATDDDTVTTLVVLRDTTGETGAIERQGLLETLELQQEILDDDETVATMSGPPFSLANVVALEAMAAEGQSVDPTDLDAQREALETRDEAEVEAIVEQVLDQRGDDYRELLPIDFQSVDDGAEAHLFVVPHERDGTNNDELSADVIEAQVAIADVTDEWDGDLDAFAFGPGIVDERSAEATGESFAVIGPLALVLVLAFLVVAYRDLLDVILSLAGIGVVLVWMGGFLGWLNLEFTQILIAVPFLLVGLSIDYGLHVIMRYREERERGSGEVRQASIIGLAGVIVAIGATTVTTTIGFFSNLTSDIGSIADFGLLSGLGIISAFLVFGLLIPAVKVELEEFLEGRGVTRRTAAFGTGGITARILGIGATGAKRAPVLIVVIIVLTSGLGAMGATQVDTSIDQNDFLPEDRQAWMEVLPASIQPGEYQLKEHAEYIDRTFGGGGADTRIDLLIRGEVTDPAAFAAIEAAADDARDRSVTVQYADGDTAVQSPLDVLERIAEDDGEFAAALDDADTTGDGLPDRDIASVLDAAFTADADTMAAVVERSGDGQYEAMRVAVTVRGDADGGTVTDEMRQSAAVADDNEAISAIATGPLIVLETVQEEVLATLITTFATTLLLVGLFLTLLFGYRHRSYSLGIVTMIPVLVALSWILGIMYLLGIPYNTETAVITAIAIGIGVDFAIHISERFVQERERTAHVHRALEATVSGTGGALLASALTTVTGFGILAFTLIPSLQRFGITTGLTIAFAWVASVLFLPSLLVLWDRHVGAATVE